jgi:hypothetical protein
VSKARDYRGGCIPRYGYPSRVLSSLTRIPYLNSLLADEVSERTAPASTVPTPAAMHAVAQLSGAPEGSMFQTIPLIYPGYMPPFQPDGQPAPVGAVPNGHPPVMPYYITSFPPTFPHPGLVPLPQSSDRQPQAGVPEAGEAGRSAAATDAGLVDPDENGGATASKRRSRGKKETKSQHR